VDLREEILKDAKQSKQYVGTDSLNVNGTINPFINFNELLQFYYFNTYHQRSIKLKAALLSQIEESDLDKYLPKNEFVKDFMYGFCVDLEMYGNAFLEKSGSDSDFYLYHILGYQGRLNKNKEIFQINTLDEAIAMEGYHLKYYSPSGKFYGEPDYLTTLDQILTSRNADKYNTSFFDNGARPGFGVIFENSSPNPEQIETFKEFFGSNYKGYTNAHKTLLLHTGKTTEGSPPAKVRLEKLDSVEDMSFEKLKNVNKNEIIAAHGVPPRLVGVMAAGQLGGGTELIDQLHAFNEIVIKPKAQTIEDFFSNIGIKHKVKLLDVTNFKDDSDLVTNLVDKQIITQLEAKELLGFNNKVK
jgi:HK97 family phage portal protein